MYYDPAATGERICNELFTWADVYDTANHDERRAILQQFIKEIRGIHVLLSISILNLI